MGVRAPHFLLFSQVEHEKPKDDKSGGRWGFVLESEDGSSKLAAADEEPDVRGDRLDLLAVVRGLEALDQPSRVTLVTRSRYVLHGLRHGLDAWRENDWQWERYGELKPVRNHDLWQRVDHAMKYHDLHCRKWRFDAAHSRTASVESNGDDATTERNAEPMSASDKSDSAQRPIRRPFRRVRGCLSAVGRMFRRGGIDPVAGGSGI